MTERQRKELDTRIHLYTIRYSEYKDIIRGIQSLLDWIQSTVSPRWLLQLEGKDTIREKLQTLRTALDTNAITKKLEAQHQLAQAYIGLSSRSVDKWINNLLDQVAKAERLKVYDASDEAQKIAEYLKLFSAVQAIDPAFV